eukprot:6326008-Amphidinium_carterae.1
MRCGTLLHLTLRRGANRLQLVHGEAFWCTRTTFEEPFGPGVALSIRSRVRFVQQHFSAIGRYSVGPHLLPSGLGFVRKGAVGLLYLMTSSGLQKPLLDLAKHFEEVDEDVARYAASQPKWTNRAKLGWRKTKTGRRRACRGGSGGARSSLPAVAEEKVSDAFLETKGAACGRPGLDGRTVFTSALRAVLVGTQNRGRVVGVPRIAFTSWDFTEDREHAVGAPGFLRDREVGFESTLIGDGFTKDREVVFEPM